MWGTNTRRVRKEAILYFKEVKCEAWKTTVRGANILLYGYQNWLNRAHSLERGGKSIIAHISNNMIYVIYYNSGLKNVWGRVIYFTTLREEIMVREKKTWMKKKIVSLQNKIKCWHTYSKSCFTSIVPNPLKDKNRYLCPRKS